jgi:hypothetical protein
MGRYIKLFPIIVCMLVVTLAVFILRDCASCFLYTNSVPGWMNNIPAKFKHLKMWRYTFHCPESWLWSQEEKTIIGLAVVDPYDKFVLDWHKFEIVADGTEEHVIWELYEGFTVILIEKSYERSEHSNGKKLIEKIHRTVLKLFFVYDKGNGKFKLDRMVKGLNPTVKRIDEFPTNWNYKTFKSDWKERPHLLDKKH